MSYLTRMNFNDGSNEQVVKLEAINQRSFQEKTTVLYVILEDRDKMNEA